VACHSKLVTAGVRYFSGTGGVDVAMAAALANQIRTDVKMPRDSFQLGFGNEASTRLH